MNVGNSNVYDGSRILQCVSDASGLGIDQVNFLTTTFLSIYVGHLYRTRVCRHQAISTQMRHLFHISIGLLFGYFCFGRQMAHLFAQSLICFLLMGLSTPDYLPVTGLVSSLGYLTLMHVYRQIYDYGNYTLDITGPLMLNTQRLSSLAFGLKDSHDEKERGKKLPEMLKNKAVRFPTALEFASYILSYQSLLVGPVSFYSDYLRFIERRGHHPHQPQQPQKHSHTPSMGHSNGVGHHGTTDHPKTTNGYSKNIITTTSPTPTTTIKEANTYKIDSHHRHHHHNNTTNTSIDNNNNNTIEAMTQYEDDHHHDCSLNAALKNRLMTAAFFGFCFLFLVPLLPLSSITGASFHERPFLSKCLLLIVFTALQRQKYYFAWKLGEAVSISSGFSYNGVDEEGEERWDLASNINILKVETSTSLKVLVDNWNISTATWLRYIIYERSKNIVHVFMFSAFWHGFYPGYYVTFCTGGLFITAARMMRRVVRPYFLSTALLRASYDGVTFLAARLVLFYIGFPFLVLELYPVYQVYKSLYFCLHIAAIVIIVVLFVFQRVRKLRARASSARTESKNHLGSTASDTKTNNNDENINDNINDNYTFTNKIGDDISIKKDNDDVRRNGNNTNHYHHLHRHHHHEKEQ